ncbi:hypothetical protein MD484_g8712, partial [Candolleomyces efflorescens]
MGKRRASARFIDEPPPYSSVTPRQEHDSAHSPAPSTVYLLRSSCNVVMRAGYHLHLLQASRYVLPAKLLLGAFYL